MLVAILLLTILFFVYRYAFGMDAKRLAADDEIPNVEIYRRFEKQVKDNIKEIQDTSFEKIIFTTKDKVRLFGRYYHRQNGAPLVLMFHGYRSSALRDGMGAFKFTQECGYNLLMVDQRAHRQSGGRTITFGVKERYDCLEWIHYCRKRFGKDTKIILIGLSMGASTVLMATGLELPSNVKGVIADCGYSTPKDILSSVIKKMQLPVEPVYQIVRLSALLYGRFDPDKASAKEALAKCKVPVLLIHGEADNLVPCQMSRDNYEACVSEKELFTVPEAEHGMSYLLAPEEYLKRVKGFLQKNFGE